MLDPENIPPVEEAELLARYVMQKGHFRSDRAVKPNLFIPHPYQELSVTRHRDATEAEIWQSGVRVANQQQRTLYGRSDILTKNCLTDSLRVTAQPFPDNPNHADIEGCRPRKKTRKRLLLNWLRLLLNSSPPHRHLHRLDVAALHLNISKPESVPIVDCIDYYADGSQVTHYGKQCLSMPSVSPTI